MESSLAPIVIFTYRRLIDKTIESLLNNTLAKESELYIFSDGNKNKNDLEDVIKVREYLKTIEGFKNIKIIESSRNKGLANSIIDGVSDVLNRHDKVISLEDDVVVSKDFLEYMNDALYFYRDSKSIWSISGYTPNVSFENYEKDVYLFGRGTSWVYGTWRDRWQSIDWEIKDWKEFRANKSLISEFKKSGNDMYMILELQILGKLNSWAIRWDYNQFKHKKYTLYPIVSKAVNIGFSDVKASNTNSEEWDRFKITLNHEKKIKLENIEPAEEVLKKVKDIYDITLYTKIGYFLKKYGGYNFTKEILKKSRI